MWIQQVGQLLNVVQITEQQEIIVLINKWIKTLWFNANVMDMTFFDLIGSQFDLEF